VRKSRYSDEQLPLVSANRHFPSLGSMSSTVVVYSTIDVCALG
jgi:hypothetical protein